jgi:predicted DNA binding CopG/RHH family protein
MSDSGGRKVPKFKTDEEAEAFLMQDLSDLDLSQFKRHHFEFEKKEAQVNLRVPEGLLNAVKERAKAQGIPYTRYIRLLMERDFAPK